MVCVTKKQVEALALPLRVVDDADASTADAEGPLALPTRGQVPVDTR